MVKIRRMVVTIVYVLDHLKDSVDWIEWSLKNIFQSNFVSPCSYVPASQKKKKVVVHFLFQITCIVDILEDLIPIV
jgi:hypothetical protein